MPGPSPSDFRPFNLGRSIQAGQDIQSKAFTLQGQQEDQQSRRLFRLTGQQANAAGAYDSEKHIKLLEGAGEFETAQNLRTLVQNRKTNQFNATVSVLDVVGKTLKKGVIRTPEDYQNIRAGLIELDPNLEKMVPKNFSQKNLDAIAGIGENADRSLGEILKDIDPEQLESVLQIDNIKLKGREGTLTLKRPGRDAPKPPSGFTANVPGDLSQGVTAIPGGPADKSGELDQAFQPTSTNIAQITRSVDKDFAEFIDPISGEFKIFDPTRRENRDKVDAKAQRIFLRNKNKKEADRLSVQESVNQAYQELGIKKPPPQKPTAAVVESDIRPHEKIAESPDGELVVLRGGVWRPVTKGQ